MPQKRASLFELFPLPLQVGYGNAAGCMIFLTSFLGLLLFRRCVNDVMLILLGMISFASGIFFMTFVTTTTTFYLGRTDLDFYFRKFEMFCFMLRESVSWGCHRDRALR